MNCVPFLADQVRSNSVQHGRSPKTSRTRTLNSAYTSVYRDRLVLRCAPREGVRVSRLLRWHREVPHQFTLQWKGRISITFVVEFIVRVAFSDVLWLMSLTIDREHVGRLLCGALRMGSARLGSR
jgi:hypothetical protein